MDIADGAQVSTWEWGRKTPRDIPDHHGDPLGGPRAVLGLEGTRNIHGHPGGTWGPLNGP